MGKVFDDYIKVLKKQKMKKGIISVIEEIDKEPFFDPIFNKKVYCLDPIPIGQGQMSEDPVTLVKMLNVFSPRKSWRILEVGTGSGYSTAILANLVKEVVTVEYYEDLALKAKEKISDNGFRNVRFFTGDATEISHDLGIFDAAIVFAACAKSPLSFIKQLREGGVMIFPLGPPYQQQITLYTNSLKGWDMTKNFRFFDYCFFQSLRGRYGWTDRQTAPVEIEEQDVPSP